VVFNPILSGSKNCVKGITNSSDEEDNNSKDKHLEGVCLLKIKNKNV